MVGDDLVMLQLRKMFLLGWFEVDYSARTSEAVHLLTENNYAIVMTCCTCDVAKWGVVLDVAARRDPKPQILAITQGGPQPKWADSQVREAPYLILKRCIQMVGIKVRSNARGLKATSFDLS
jgi:hypothetical protein